ncbi:MAG: hypothetical protein AB1Z29_10200 [Desulfobacterales bacterium]|jgi:hypothetical protein
MKRLLTIVIILALVSGMAMAEDLIKLSLDDAASIGTTIQTDSEVKTEGQSSVRITTKHSTTVCLGEVIGLNVEDARLLYTAKVKSDLDGVAFLEMWVHVGGGQYFSRGMTDPIKGKSDWMSIQTPFMFQKGQNPDVVILNLVINGKGTVWIDDVVLSKAALK